MKRKREERERLVRSDTARGLTPRLVSERRGIPVDEVRSLAASSRDPLEDIARLDLRGEIERALSYSAATIEDYQRLFEEADTDAHRLRALEGRAKSIRERFELLQHFGALPGDPRVWARVPHYDMLGSQFLDELEMRGVDHDVVMETLGAIAEAGSLEAIFSRPREQAGEDD